MQNSRNANTESRNEAVASILPELAGRKEFCRGDTIMAMRASRFVMIIFLAAAMQCRSSQITNICDILDVPLTSNVFACITAQDRTTPDLAFLGSVRAFFLGNANNVKFYFTDGLWRAATGLEPDVVITEALSSNFRNMMCDGGVSNQVFISFSRSETNAAHIIDSTLTDRLGCRVTTNSFKFVFVQTNSTWRIDDLFLDGESVRTDD